jgi:hypothetical protein
MGYIGLRKAAMKEIFKRIILMEKVILFLMMERFMRAIFRIL